MKTLLSRGLTKSYELGPGKVELNNTVHNFITNSGSFILSQSRSMFVLGHCRYCQKAG